MVVLLGDGDVDSCSKSNAFGEFKPMQYTLSIIYAGKLFKSLIAGQTHAQMNVQLFEELEVLLFHGTAVGYKHDGVGESKAVAPVSDV